MKIISLVLASVLLVTMTSATSISSKELTNKILVSDLLKRLLDCLFAALKSIVGSDLTAILQELQAALGQLGVCVNLSNPDLVGILQCIVSKLGTISADNLADIVKQVQPILQKVSGSLTCISALINEICKINICGTIPILCFLSSLGPLGPLDPFGILQKILKAVFTVVQGLITALLTNGVCKGIALPSTNLVTDLLKGLLKCLFDALKGIVGSDLTAILTEIKEALGKLGDCVNISSTNPDLVGILQCLLSKVGTISAEDLAVIVKRLQPILEKVNGTLTCIRALIKDICKIDICGSFAILCELNLPGILGTILATIVKTLQGVITSLLTNGVCKLT